MTATVVIDCDPSPFEAVTAALFAEFSKRSLQAGLVRARGLEALAQPCRVEVRDLSAPGASKCLVVLHPSDALLGFLAAVRAGDFDV